MNIQCIRLSTGDDVIGDLEVNGMADTYTIKEPLSIIVMPTGNNNFTVGLAPFLPFTEKSSKARIFTFKSQHVLTTYEPSLDLRNEYSRINGGIVLAKPELGIIK